MADISQFPITHLVFPFAISTLEGPTYFSRFRRGTSFREEAQHTENTSVNTEKVPPSSQDRTYKSFAAAKPLAYYSLA